MTKDELMNLSKDQLLYNDVVDCKKTYINVDCSKCSNCSGCFDCSDCSNCSWCSNCSDCSDCYKCSYCSNCSDCSNCPKCSKCSKCSDCYKITNGKNLQYVAFGVQLTKEEYSALMKKIN